MRFLLPLVVLNLILSSAASSAAETAAILKLPTKNTKLFSNAPDTFYMYTNRNFEGKSSKPWQGGAYGFTRNMKRTESGIIGTRFHEGIDIKPIKRDKNGTPLDIVTPIAKGYVVYTNSSAKLSNYGKYVVIQHNWGSGPFFSLYAHLATVTVKSGQAVSTETGIGKLGFTGRGINKARAHLHLELNMMLSSQFDSWHRKYLGANNIHGFYNGMNMIGLDISTMLKLSQQNNGLKVSEFVRKKDIYYRVTLPRKSFLELLERYPWLCPVNPNVKSPSWEISLTAAGIPTMIVPSRRRVSRPTVTFVKPSRIDHSLQTKGFVLGNGQTAKLSKKGLRYIELLSTSSLPTTITQPNKP